MRLPLLVRWTYILPPQSAQYIAYALPVLPVAVGRLSAFRLSQRK